MFDITQSDNILSTICPCQLVLLLSRTDRSHVYIYTALERLEQPDRGDKKQINRILKIFN